jgi:hypothetical protein
MRVLAMTIFTQDSALIIGIGIGNYTHSPRYTAPATAATVWVACPLRLAAFPAAGGSGVSQPLLADNPVHISSPCRDAHISI